MEVYVLVPVRKTTGAKIVGTIMLVLAVVSLLAACLTRGITLPIAVVCGIVWFVLMGNSKEFEYSYFDGEVRFAKVLNKNRRKSLGSYSMDDVIQIAPAGDRSVSQYEREGNVKVIDYTSHDKAAGYYDMILKKEGDTLLIKFEPDDKYLEAVEYKYRQKVIRRSTQA
mgnify:CR=1 FL=1